MADTRKEVDRHSDYIRVVVKKSQRKAVKKKLKALLNCKL